MGMELQHEEIGTSEKLYQFLSKRLEQEGESLPCTLDAMKVYARSARAELDYLDLINLDNRSLVDACYSISFNFSPPDDYIDQWREDIEKLSKDEFHKKFMNSFVRLRNFSVRHVRLRNCICLDMPARIKPGLSARRRAGLYRLLHPIYSRMPASMKDRLKRALWDKFFVR